MYFCRLLALKNPPGMVEVGLSKFDKYFEFSECLVDNIVGISRNDLTIL